MTKTVLVAFAAQLLLLLFCSRAPEPGPEELDRIAREAASTLERAEHWQEVMCSDTRPIADSAEGLLEDPPPDHCAAATDRVEILRRAEERARTAAGSE